MSDPVLRAEGMQKRFGGVHALRGAELTVYPGEVHALVGENGSGKSTLLKILSGQLQPDAGTIVLDGRGTSFRGAADALRQGISTVTQETTLAPDLSIAENVLLGRRMPRRGRLIDWRRTRVRAREALLRLDLDLDPSTPVRRLRPDQQQLVEIARALSVDARVLILDEPTSSLTDDEVESLFSIVRRLGEQRVATIFVSHRLNEVFLLADRVTVMRDGHTVGGGLAAEFDAQRLIQLMVGRALGEQEPLGQAQTNETAVLRVRGFGVPGACDGIDLDVAPGEIVGLAGLVGAGRTELLEAIFGLRRGYGLIEVDGCPVSYRAPRQAIRDGVALVPSDRKAQGLVLEMSVRENLMMASTSSLLRLRRPSTGHELGVVDATVRDLRIRAHSHRAPVSTLSGGNQQKVVLGKWLATSPRLLMLDDPTRGVDVGAKAEIYRLLRAAAERGIGVLASSSEIPELLALCDRIVVMFRGRVAASLAREEATEAVIAHFAGRHR
jgi:ABC-type sugar transport system ATPase subunit